MINLLIFAQTDCVGAESFLCRKLIIQFFQGIGFGGGWDA
jgi:hypothetical protein